SARSARSRTTTRISRSRSYGSTAAACARATPCASRGTPATSRSRSSRWRSTTCAWTRLTRGRRSACGCASTRARTTWFTRSRAERSSGRRPARGRASLGLCPAPGLERPGDFAVQGFDALRARGVRREERRHLLAAGHLRHVLPQGHGGARIEIRLRHVPKPQYVGFALLGAAE